MTGIRLPFRWDDVFIATLLLDADNQVICRSDILNQEKEMTEYFEYIVTACNAYPELSTRVAELVDENIKLEKKVKELEEALRSMSASI